MRRVRLYRALGRLAERLASRADEWSWALYDRAWKITDPDAPHPYRVVDMSQVVTELSTASAQFGTMLNAISKAPSDPDVDWLTDDLSDR